jgi:hypothetical protein
MEDASANGTEKTSGIKFGLLRCRNKKYNSEYHKLYVSLNIDCTDGNDGRNKKTIQDM